jgi:hypothetical protein
MARRKTIGRRIDGWVKTNPVTVVIVAAALLLSSTIAIVTFVTDLAEQIIDWIDDEPDPRLAQVAQLRGGMSLERFREVLGAPLFVTAPPSTDAYREAVFQGKGFWVQAIIDQHDTVQLWVISSCDESFRPTFSIILGVEAVDVTLHTSPMTVLDGRMHIDASIYQIPGGSRPLRLFDLLSAGNPSGFVTYGVGVNDACPLDSGPIQEMLVATEQNVFSWDASPPDLTENAVVRMRETLKINSFAQSAPFANVAEIVASIPLGADRQSLRPFQ